MFDFSVQKNNKKFVVFRMDGYGGYPVFNTDDFAKALDFAKEEMTNIIINNEKGEHKSDYRVNVCHTFESFDIIVAEVSKANNDEKSTVLYVWMPKNLNEVEGLAELEADEVSELEKFLLSRLTPQQRFHKKNKKRFYIDCFATSENDIIEHLERQTSKASYIKTLIRTDIEKNKE